MNKHLNPKVQESLDLFDTLVEKVGIEAIAKGYLSARKQDGDTLNNFIKQNSLYINTGNRTN